MGGKRVFSLFVIISIMVKIVVTNSQDFTEDQVQKLNNLGEVEYYDSLPTDGEDYLSRVKNADIICSGTAGLKDAYSRLKDVYITVSFVSVAFVDLEVMKSNNVTISNAPGANRYAVSEWIIGMMIMMARRFEIFLNRKETFRDNGSLPPLSNGLAGQAVTVLGSGNIGLCVGKVLTAMGMEVSYFKRGDDLHDSVKNVNFVVDALGSNETTKGLLDDSFFTAMKQGSHFITVSGSTVVDEDALLRALDNDHLSGAATDCGRILVGDTEDLYYKKFLNHPKVLATPHIAYNTALSMKTGNDIMISNVETWINGTPQNVVTE